MNVDGFRYAGKARVVNFELIDAIRQALHVQATLVTGRQCISILIRLARDLNCYFHAKPPRIDDFNAQFAAIALAEERESAKEENN